MHGYLTICVLIPTQKHFILLPDYLPLTAYEKLQVDHNLFVITEHTFQEVLVSRSMFLPAAL